MSNVLDFLGLTKYHNKVKNLIKETTFSVSADAATKTVTFAPPSTVPVATAPSYSTAEQEVGINWVDGKPLYQRTFVYNNTSLNFGGSLDHDLNYSEIDVIFITNATHQRKTAKDLASSNCTSNLEICSTYFHYKYGQGEPGGTEDDYYYITVQYTKK